MSTEHEEMKSPSDDQVGIFAQGMLTQLARMGASAAGLSLAMQLFDVAPCPVCNYRKLHCRCTLPADAQQPPVSNPAPFQERVQPWMLECFGAEIASDKQERNHRFFEEATELVQACGMTASEAHQLVNYTFGRTVGEAPQEVGGVMVTLAALCLAQHLDMHDAAEVELVRIWTKTPQIRAKQAAKPKHSPLPQSAEQDFEKWFEAWRRTTWDSLPGVCTLPPPPHWNRNAKADMELGWNAAMAARIQPAPLNPLISHNSEG